MAEVPLFQYGWTTSRLPQLGPHGSVVDIQPCAANAANQDWTFSNGQVSIFNGTQCLDVINGVNQDGVHLQVWDCVSGNANQQFYYTGDNR